MRSVIRGFSVSLLAASVCVGWSSTARAGAGCDSQTSGIGTDKLCPGEHLVANSRLVSPNGNYEFWFQGDGYAVLYDTSSPGNPVALYVLANPSYGDDDPGILSYGDEECISREICQSDQSISIWDDDDHIVWSTSGVGMLNSPHSFRVDNDGCLAYYISNTRVGSFYCN